MAQAGGGAQRNPGFRRSRSLPTSVVPAQAGIQDFRFRRAAVGGPFLFNAPGLRPRGDDERESPVRPPGQGFPVYENRLKVYTVSYTIKENA